METSISEIVNTIVVQMVETPTRYAVPDWVSMRWMHSRSGARPIGANDGCSPRWLAQG